jgi:hypothetical protein
LTRADALHAFTANIDNDGHCKRANSYMPHAAAALAVVGDPAATLNTENDRKT